MKSPFDYHDRKSHKQSRSRSPVRKRYKRSWSHSVKSPFEHDAEKCCKQSRSQERKRYNRSGSCSMNSPFDYHGDKHHKQSRSRSPERKRYNRSWSQSLQSPFEYHGKKCCKQSRSDHRKGKDTREVSHDLCKVLLTIMLKNTINSIKAVHDL